MKQVLKKDWFYSLYEENDEFFLHTLCGGVAQFEIRLKLSEQEKSDYNEKGEKFIDSFSKSIQENPNDFSTRNIQD